MASRFTTLPAPRQIERFECTGCGSHVLCVRRLATVEGRCSTCGSYALAPLEPPKRRPALVVTRSR